MAQLASQQSRRVVVGAGLHCCGEARALQLPHPATGKPAAFLLSPGGEQVLEVNHLKSEYTSWFVGDSVVEDGGVYAATPVDVLFLLLPLLERARGPGRYVSVEQLLEDEACPAFALLRPAAAAALPSVCATQVVGEEWYYRLEDERLLAWLRLKVQALAASLATGATAGAAFEALDGASRTAYACELLGEYLAQAVLERLRAHLGVAAIAHAPVEAPLPHFVEADERGGAPPEKKAKLSAAAKASASRTANNQVKNAKAAEGSRSLASFFGGKPKQ